MLFKGVHHEEKATRQIQALENMSFRLEALSSKLYVGLGFWA